MGNCSETCRKNCPLKGLAPVFGVEPILFNEGTELSVVQRQLRHTNPNTTARYLRSLGYEAEHEQKVLAVMEGRGPAKVLNFADKKNGSPDLQIRRAGTQSRYTEPGNLKATGA